MEIVEKISVCELTAMAEKMSEPLVKGVVDAEKKSLDNYGIDRERWARLSVVEMMANIGSEVGRAIIAHREGKQNREDRAIDRAIDLFSATVEVLVGTPYAHCLKEILRARDEFLRLFFDGTFEADAGNIERYFANIAYFARYESGR